METLIVQPKDQKQLATVEAILKALDVTFKKGESSEYDADFIKKIEKSKAQVKAGKTTKIKPADITKIQSMFIQ